MPTDREDIEDVDSVSVEDEEKDKKSASKSKSKFLSIGKYFLILLVLGAQGYGAYGIVNANYEKIYGFFDSFKSDHSGSYQMEELIVNPAETNGQRYLMVQISLELKDKDDTELIDKNKMKIRHDLIEFLSSRTVDQLIHFEQRELLRKEMVDIINDAVGKRSVRNLYYTKYVMQ